MKSFFLSGHQLGMVRAPKPGETAWESEVPSGDFPLLMTSVFLPCDFFFLMFRFKGS